MPMDIREDERENNGSCVKPRYARPKFVVVSISVLLIICIFVVSCESKLSADISEIETGTGGGISTAEEYDVEKGMPVLQETMDAWSSHKISEEEALAKLRDLQRAPDNELSTLAGQKIDIIVAETRNSDLYDAACEYLKEKDYVNVFETAGSIDETFSKYDSVLVLQKNCAEEMLASLVGFEDEDEFEKAIKLLSDCNSYYPYAAFDQRQEELKVELATFREISDIINRATKLYDGGQVGDAFALLAMTLETHPSDERLACALVNYRDHFIIATTQNALALSDREEYKQALQVVDGAIDQYDCEEFQLLKESIKEQKSILYRLKNDTVRKFKVFAKGWEEETLDVQQLSNAAGSYVMKSGEKLLLGDYSNENVTVLSFGGNIIASLSGIDFFMDLRDVTYDLTHWGQEEYFAVYLAADVIALIPVIGMIKYMDHFKTVARGADASAEIVDSVSDVGKNSTNVAVVVDKLTDVTKTGNNIIDTVNSAKNSIRKLDVAHDISKGLSDNYKLVDTRNFKLVGSRHPVTGVPFKLKRVEYTKGNMGDMIQAVFPVFKSFSDIELPKELYKASFAEQQKYCLKQLKKQTRPLIGRDRGNFTKEQLKDIGNNRLPDGFTWHHNEEEGLMQLVNSDIHKKTPHTGGMALWGIGYDNAA